MTIKEKIQKILKHKGISAAQLETDLGFAKGYISKLDKSYPSSENIVKIADYLNVTTDSLLKEDPAAELINEDIQIRTISKLTSEYADEIEKKNKQFVKIIKDIMTQEHEGFITFAGYNQKVEQEALERFERYKSLPPETQMAIDLLLGYKKPSPEPLDSQENTDK